MVKQSMYTILSNNQINHDTYEMVLKGDTSSIKGPGQFVEVHIPGEFLARPFSIAYYSSNSFNIVYRVVGEGTEKLSKMKENEQLKIMTGLGHGFDLEVNSTNPLLIGGGTGVAPLYSLAIALVMKNVKPTVIMGFKSENDRIYYDEFRALGLPVYCTFENTPEKANGKLVTDVLTKLEGYYDYFYACGPKGMLKAVVDLALTEGEVSMESRMACGIGQCKCCSVETKEGMKTLCKDGPVLKKGVVKL